MINRWWSLTIAQWEAIKSHIEGKVVHDLGAADLSLSYKLVEGGAKKVVALDRRISFLRVEDERIKFVQTYFHNYQGKIDVALISWPVNWPCGLDHLAARASKVIYLGNNFDGAACGDGPLWKHFQQRNVLAHCPDPANTLIVYGKITGRVRPPLPEEMAGTSDQIARYEDFYQKGA